MADLTTAERLTRFGENEERVQTFVNETGTYTTTENVEVETLPSFLARKNAEVNTDIDSILSQATAAAEAAEASADLAEAAASNLPIRKYPASGPLIATAGQTEITPGFTLDTVKDNVAVYIDGVKQARGTYSFTSTTITLSEALTGVETIEVFSADTTAAGSAPLYQANNFSDVLNKNIAIQNLLSGYEADLRHYVNDVGDLVPSLTTSKTGFVLCNGGAYSRTTYAALFAILGTAFGAGDGSTTFNVPDFRGRTFQGANANLKAVLAAGLPNITGYFAGFPGAPSGAFGYLTNWLEYGGVGNFGKGIDFSASRSSAIYGASTTVQPPAIAANIFIKY